MLSQSQPKRPEDKAPKNTVSFIYLTEIAGTTRNVTVTWSNTISTHSLIISLENLRDEQNHYTIKIDLKDTQFWGKKGLKSLEADGRRVDVYWDFRQAKFTNIPEPSSEFYVALISEEAISLIIGDLKNEAIKRTRKKPSSTEATLVCKKEHVYGKRVFYTRTIMDESKREHEVVIETSLSGPEDPEMWITVDGYPAIRIMNLNWRFRGNEVVTVKNNNVQLEIFWDVHDWLFEPSDSHSGLFIFKPISGSEGRSDSLNGSNNGDVKSVREYYHVLYAMKID